MTVQCVNCGLLGLRRRSDIVAAHQKSRSLGVDDGFPPNYIEIHAEFVCFANSPAFTGPTLKGGRGSGSPKGGNHPSVIEINRERECMAYCAWDRTLTPQEHLQQVKDKAENIRLETDRVSQNHREEVRHNQMFWLTIIGILIAIAGVWATIRYSGSSIQFTPTPSIDRTPITDEYMKD